MQRLRQRMREGCAFNGWLSLPCAFSAELMARMQWDSVTIDMQHGLADYAAMTAMLSAAGAADSQLPVLVRVPWLDEGHIMRALDAGASGIICPMINSRAEAERFASCVRYPPQGRRSFGPIRAQAVFGPDYFARANSEILALAMIETRQAVQCADEILSAPGIDGAYIGPADLSVSFGAPPSFAPTDAEVLAAIDAVLAAAKRCGKAAGIHANDAPTARAAAARGFSFATAATDARLLAAGGATVVDQLKKSEKGEKDEKQTADHGAGAGAVSGGAAY